MLFIFLGIITFGMTSGAPQGRLAEPQVFGGYVGGAATVSCYNGHCNQGSGNFNTGSGGTKHGSGYSNIAIIQGRLANPQIFGGNVGEKATVSCAGGYCNQGSNNSNPGSSGDSNVAIIQEVLAEPQISEGNVGGSATVSCAGGHCNQGSNNSNQGRLAEPQIFGGDVRGPATVSCVGGYCKQGSNNSNLGSSRTKQGSGDSNVAIIQGRLAEPQIFGGDVAGAATVSCFGGHCDQGSSNSNQGRLAEPQIFGGDVGGAATVSCVGGHCNQGSNNSNQGSGGIKRGSGDSNVAIIQGRLAEPQIFGGHVVDILKPCPYYAGHPKQDLCKYAPFTWTPHPAV